MDHSACPGLQGKSQNEPGLGYWLGTLDADEGKMTENGAHFEENRIRREEYEKQSAARRWGREFPGSPILDLTRSFSRAMDVVTRSVSPLCNWKP
jgi:hypothetical protein